MARPAGRVVLHGPHVEGITVQRVLPPRGRWRRRARWVAIGLLTTIGLLLVAVVGIDEWTSERGPGSVATEPAPARAKPAARGRPAAPQSPPIRPAPPPSARPSERTEFRPPARADEGSPPRIDAAAAQTAATPPLASRAEAMAAYMTARLGRDDAEATARANAASYEPGSSEFAYWQRVAEAISRLAPAR